MEDNNIYNEDETINSYVKMKNKLDIENSNFDYVINHMPPVYSKTDAYIKNYVKNLSKDELHSRAESLIKVQNLRKNDDLFEHMSEKNLGNFSHFRSQWSPIIWQTHEENDTKKIKLGDKIVYAYDLDFSIAQSIELQDAGRDPATEYYDWIKIQSRLENDINTNGTTLSEIDRRNTFIDFMDMRETEIKRIASLYSAAALNPNSSLQELAQEKLKFTLFKLSELRRLRDRMKSTKSHADNFKSLPVHVQNAEKIRRNITKTNVYSSAEIEDSTNEDGSSSQLNSFGEHCLSTMFVAHAINNHLVDDYTKTKPETKSVEEAMEKISTLEDNSQNFHEMLTAMRNGLSKEEWLMSKQEDLTPTSHQKDFNIRGFDIARYNQALKELTA